MERLSLNRTDDYELVHDDQDIRGWEMRDATGQPVGRVEDLFVNTDTEYVDVIRLKNGMEVPARDVYIGDDAVYLEEVAGQETIRPLASVHDEFGRVRGQSSAAR
jgi:hypothetical protein